MSTSLVAQLFDHAATTPEKVAMKAKVRGAWRAFTWGDYRDEVRAIARGLIALGHAEGECVALVGKNRPEWVFCEMAIMAVRGVPAPIYTTSTPEQVAFIVNNSRARIAIADDAEQLGRYRDCIAAGAMAAEVLVVMDALNAPGAVSLDALKALGTDAFDAELDRRIATIGMEDLAVLIYTSGTTGTPKGVMLDHGNVAALVDAVRERYAVYFDENEYRVVSYLPLCHVAEQIFTVFAHLSTGGEVWFCPDLKEIKEHLLEAHPTVFLGVPRVWEKFQAALEAKLSQSTGFKAWLTDWARRTELAAFEAEARTGAPVGGLSRALANRLVISKVKGALGLDRLQLAATGAAPIATHTLRFFASLGIVIHEAYGMSETTGVTHVQPYRRPRFGTVGPALVGVEARIAEDGEICVRGRTMTRGYLHLPEQTAELFTADGWLCTGDLGEIGEDGYLRITGRKKDLLITSGGKNVAPAELEAYLQQIVGVAQAVVVGDRQPYLCALVTLDPENLGALRTLTNAPDADVATLAADPRVTAFLMAEAERLCNAKVASYQTIKRLRVLPVDFSVDGGELTPTMKLKRNVVSTKYAAEIEAVFVG